MSTPETITILLTDALSTCREPDWDGYDAEPVDQAAERMGDD